jgi:GT2 family glycosyltransferase
VISAAPGSVYAQIVGFNSLRAHGAGCLEECLRSLLNQGEFTPGADLFVHFCDNGSSDGTLEWAQSAFGGAAIDCHRNQHNLGFSGAYNQGAREFLESRALYFLVLNPDLALEVNALAELRRFLEKHPRAGAACPQLYRADESLRAVEPRVHDAAGMYITPGLRHFDRGSGCAESEEYARPCYVFGGSGACILMRRDFVKDVLLDCGERERDLGRVYPELLEGRELRAPLFDEGFFAYREDADLAWRGQLLGWRCAYVPTAVGYHRRVVLPERRSELAPELNLYGVRNRFLLQINNLSFWSLSVLFWGVLARNAVVILGVLLYERRSLRGLGDVLRLYGRARARRRALLQRARVSPREMKRWFRFQAYTEPIL